LEKIMRTPSDYQEQARLLKLLANDTRLKIVDRLARGECNVSTLTKMSGLDPSTVSKHLSMMRSGGIVRDRRKGNAVYYRLLTPCVLKFSACAAHVLKERTGR